MFFTPVVLWVAAGIATTVAGAGLIVLGHACRYTRAIAPKHIQPPNEYDSLEYPLKRD